MKSNKNSHLLAACSLSPLLESVPGDALGCAEGTRGAPEGKPPITNRGGIFPKQSVKAKIDNPAYYGTVGFDWLS